MAIVFNTDAKTITIESPATSETIQNLLNEIRTFESGELGVSYDKIANATGKEDIGSGDLVGITMILVNDWRIVFEDRAGPSTESVVVSGGNLVAVNSFSNNPVKPSTFTQVQIRQSASPTLNPESSRRVRES